LANAIGVIVAVQLGATPPNTIFATGAIKGSEEVAERFKTEQLITLSISAILKLTTIGVFSFVS